MAIDSAAVERMLLASAVASGFGLHEAIWDINAQYPDERLSAKYEAAEHALRSLIQRGWIDLCRTTMNPAGRYGDLHVIDSKSVDNVLENPVSWYPSYKDIKVVFRQTESGKKAHETGTWV